MLSDRDFIDATKRKCQALQASGLWPPTPEIRPLAWLENFQATERVLAAVILDNFVFFADRLSNHLFRAAYADALNSAKCEDPALGQRIEENAVFTPVEGEPPNLADSGLNFCRRSRQVLGVGGERILKPRDALAQAIAGAPVVFVDDFVGSGDQLIDTWERAYSRSAPESFAAAYRLSPFEVSYVALAATTYGLKRIAQESIPIRVYPAHELTHEYSVTRVHYGQHAPAIPDLGGEIENLLDRYAPGLVLPDYMKVNPGRTLGYHGLGLMVGFEHSIPDATLPILWAESSKEGWTPLRRRA